MYYCDRNFKTKKELKIAVESDQEVTIFPTEPHEQTIKDGTVAVGGPHYPQPHKWYASVTVKNGVVVKVK